MSNADDMVITPRLDDSDRRAVPIGERTAKRRINKRRRRSTFVRRLVQRRAAQKAAQIRATKVRAARARRLASQAGAGSAGNTIARQVGKRIVSTPVGAVAAAAVIVGAIIARKVTGKSFSTMGAQLRRSIIGSAAEEARAKMDAYNTLAGNREIRHLAGVMHGPTPGMKAAAQMLMRNNARYQYGVARLEEDERFQSDSSFDLMIKRVDEFFGGAMMAEEDKLLEIGRALHHPDNNDGAAPKGRLGR